MMQQVETSKLFELYSKCVLIFITKNSSYNKIRIVIIIKIESIMVIGAILQFIRDKYLYWIPYK